MNKLKTIFRILCAGVALYVVYVICVVSYSIFWMKPHAEQALKQFKDSAVIGMKVSEVQELANKVGADKYVVFDLSPPEHEATKVAVVMFFNFPYGLSRNICRLYLRNETVVLIDYSYRG